MHGVMVSFIVECRDYSQPKPFFRHAQRHIRADADALDVWTYSRSRSSSPVCPTTVQHSCESAPANKIAKNTGQNYGIAVMFLSRRGIAMDPSTLRILYPSFILSLDTSVCRLDAGPRPARVHEMWQTEFSYFRIIGWGWYSLSTVLDDFSRYIMHDRLERLRDPTGKV
jgi:transposase InsO family protein